MLQNRPQMDHILTKVTGHAVVVFDVKIGKSDYSYIRYYNTCMFWHVALCNTMSYI